MGFLYIKVIESKKVAVRSSFFVNYPFIRLRIGKEKKNTNFKPGVEWWDKIYSFQNVSADENVVLIAQARDKSIHVFGSDWLGEVQIKLRDYMDGNVHQIWFKLGKGHKQHGRSPRGYVHLAFHYFDSHPSGRRPFSVPPVETVMAFEDWLACQDNSVQSADSFYSASTTDINPTPINQRNEERLRRSAPSNARSSWSPDRDQDRKAHISSKPKSKSVNYMEKPETRARSNTVPADPRRSASARADESSDDSEDESESLEEGVKMANLIDFSFDAPKKSSAGHASNIGGDLFNRESPVTFSPKNLTSSRSASASTVAPTVAPQDILSKINNNPTFEDWYHPNSSNTTVSYNPQNPFLALHDTHAPAFALQK